MGNHLLLVSAILAFAFSVAYASDPGPLQDFCVAISDPNSAVFVNGLFCKDPKLATANDFSFWGLQTPKNTSNQLGSIVTPVTVDQLAGLNTLGISAARIDFAPYGLNPPHTHPRATEVVFVLEGTLDVGFITTAKILVSKSIKPGDIFVFPKGLVHFQKNTGKGPASVISAFNSQLPGTQSIAATLFTATPTVPDNVLAKAFHIGTGQVEKIKQRFLPH